jgi:hypothetical protein
MRYRRRKRVAGGWHLLNARKDEIDGWLEILDFGAGTCHASGSLPVERIVRAG